MSERQVSRQLRLAYVAPAVLKRLIYGREPLAITLLRLIDIATLPWHEQEVAAFEDNSD